MQLLVSVTNSEEAVAAVNGGADAVDAKDPSNGALGAVSVTTLQQIHSAVAERRTLSAALGEPADEKAAESCAHVLAEVGVSFVKVGFAGVPGPTDVAGILAAAVRGARAASQHRCGVVAVMYADLGPSGAVDFTTLVNVAVQTGASGVLVDTAHKGGPGLLQFASRAMLRSWVAQAHDAGLTIALAGKLTAGDLPVLRDTGADIAGVRGAACHHGRTGRVAEERVRALRRQLRNSSDAVSTSGSVSSSVSSGR